MVKNVYITWSDNAASIYCDELDLYARGSKAPKTHLHKEVIGLLETRSPYVKKYSKFNKGVLKK